MEVVLGISLFVLSNPDVKFDARKLTCRKQTIVEVMPIARQVKLIDKEKFMEATPDRASEIFVIHVTTLEIPISIMIVQSTRKLFLAVPE